MQEYIDKRGLSQKEAVSKMVASYTEAIKKYKGTDKDYIPDYKKAISIAKGLMKPSLEQQYEKPKRVGGAFLSYNAFQKSWAVKDNYSTEYFKRYKDAVKYAKNPEAPINGLITVLEPLTLKNTLSSQLRKLTGDSFTLVNFKDHGKEKGKLSTAKGTILEHIKTGRLFEI